MGKNYFYTSGKCVKDVEKNTGRFAIHEYDAIADQWESMPDFQVIGVNPCTMFGMFAIKDKVLLLFRIGRILSLDFKEEALSISNEEKLADLFEKQDNDKKFIYAFQTTLKTNTKGLVAGDRKMGLHYFLDLDSLTLKWTRLSRAEDPTICSFHFAHQNKCLWCVCLYFR